MVTRCLQLGFDDIEWASDHAADQTSACSSLQKRQLQTEADVVSKKKVRTIIDSDPWNQLTVLSG